MLLLTCPTLEPPPINKNPYLQSSHLTAYTKNIADSVDVDAYGQFQFLIETDSGGSVEDD